MPIHNKRKTNRRSYRVKKHSRRVSRRHRTRRHRMRGGAQHIIRFKVILVQGGVDQPIAFVEEHKQDIVMKLQQIRSEMVQTGDLPDNEVERFEFNHLGENEFEMKFEVIFQQGSQANINSVREGHVEAILDKFAEEYIVINGVRYSIEIETTENNNNNSQPGQQ